MTSDQRSVVPNLMRRLSHERPPRSCNHEDVRHNDGRCTNISVRSRSEFGGHVFDQPRHQNIAGATLSTRGRHHKRGLAGLGSYVLVIASDDATRLFPCKLRDTRDRISQGPGPRRNRRAPQHASLDSMEDCREAEQVERHVEV
jgi:hypothetical protein